MSASRKLYFYEKILLFLPKWHEMRMPQIIPIRDLKNTAEISELCHSSNGPIYITKNGYGDMVIMSIEWFKKTMEQLNLYKEIIKFSTSDVQIQADTPANGGEEE